MIARTNVFCLFLLLLLASCTREFDCADVPIQTAFIAFPISDIDTVILKKYRANDNYQTLIDSFRIVYGYTAQYHTSTDTTTVVISDGISGVKAGFDWQLFIPAKSRTVFISGITSEKKTGKCGSGIFSMDKFGCTCANRVFSAIKDNQVINFPNSDTGRNTLYIRN